MTFWDLLVAVCRLWYVALFGLVATVFFALSVSQQPGVFQGRVDVLLLLPQSARNPNSYTATTQSLISTAGIVATVVSGASGAPTTSSSNVTLAGQGIRDGWSVRLPNSGGQWANNFDRPMLDVQVVGPTYNAVLTRINDLVTRIETELTRRQNTAGVSPDNLIRTRLSPPLPQITYSQGSHLRAQAASLLLGTLLTLTTCLLLHQHPPHPPLNSSSQHDSLGKRSSLCDVACRGTRTELRRESAAQDSSCSALGRGNFSFAVFLA